MIGELLELVVDPLSSASIFILVVKELKGIQASVQQVSLHYKPSWFTSLSFTQQAPLLVVHRKDQAVTISELLSIV